MLKTQSMLMDELKAYANPKTKLSRLVKENVYFPIVRGLYETSPHTAGYLLAGSIYGPSYLSFEFALSFYGLIPERVTTFTSATCLKKKKKFYDTPFGVFTYQDIPLAAYPYGILIREENEYTYRIASPEKALCDQLYASPLIKNLSQLSDLLFNNLRIDEYELTQLNYSDLELYTSLYGSSNVKLLGELFRRRRI